MKITNTSIRLAIRKPSLIHQQAKAAIFFYSPQTFMSVKIASQQGSSSLKKFSIVAVVFLFIGKNSTSFLIKNNG